MPTELFAKIDEKKRESIFEASLSEFAAQGYSLASTNRIVRASEISKGSLFQYFETKESLYYYVLDRVVAEYIEALGRHFYSSDLFEMVSEYVRSELGWYAAHPREYRLLLEAFHNDGSEISRRIAERYGREAGGVYDALLQSVDMSRFSGDRKTLTNVLKWTLDGLKEAFSQRLLAAADGVPSELFEAYTKELERCLAVLKEGFFRDARGAAEADASQDGAPVPAKAEKPSEWVLCPVCGGKTRIKIRDDTEIDNFPLYCPRCRRETLVEIRRSQVRRI